LLRDLPLAIRLGVLLVLFQLILSLTTVVPAPYVELMNPQAVLGLTYLVSLFFLLHLCCGLFSPSRQWRVALAGSVLGVGMLVLIERSSLPELSNLLRAYVIAGGMGIAAFGSFLARMRSCEEHERTTIRLLVANLIVVLCVLATVPSAGLKLTKLLHPRTFDTIAFHFDQALGFQPSVVLASLIKDVPFLGDVLWVAYNLLPWGFPILYAYLQRDEPRRRHFDLLGFWLLSAAIALVGYQIVPVAGPSYAFAASFPFDMPAANIVASIPMTVMPAPRNGIPSMHFGWALSFWLVSHLLQRSWLRQLFAVFLGTTVLATLGLGEHYAVDLVVSVPMILAAFAFCLKGGDRRIQRQTVLIGGSLFVFWMVFLRFGVAVAVSAPLLVLLAAAMTIIACTLAYRRLLRSDLDQHPASTVLAAPAELPREALLIAGIFVVSGFAGLVYEVVFSKALALSFGSSALATYTVLATYMTGMALGSWLGGSVSEKCMRPLGIYVACELGIGIYCLMTPFLFTLIRDLYIAVASGSPPESSWLTLVRFGLGMAVLLLPTVLMGATVPLLAKFLERKSHSIGVSVSVLYGANTLGAAVGALFAGYALIPMVGVMGTTFIAAALSLCAGLFALRIQKAAAVVVAPPTQIVKPVSNEIADRALGWTALAILVIGGMGTLVLEIDYIHLLATVAGNSAYAFSLMLFTFLIGLSGGGIAAKRLLTTQWPPAVLLVWLECGLATMLLLGVPGWEQIPAYLSDYAGYPVAHTFAAREFVRACACAMAMLPPSLFIGAIYPVALQCIGLAFPQRKFLMLGRAMGANTLGNIAGVIVGGFVLLPLAGALRSIHVLALSSLFLALLALLRTAPRYRAAALLPISVVVVLGISQPASFDYGALASGANVYFSPQQRGRVVDHAESLDGGVTTVAINKVGQTEVKTLMTNGKFQGNDAMEGEMKAQVGFAIAPLLHASERKRALVIGYGTGVTARTLHDAGFAELDIAELSQDILTMANRHFSAINHLVSEQTGVHAHVTDGRNLLMLEPAKYDVISVEITSIWFAGAASLYNREFYQLASQHLNPHGVLQQWVQLHHMRGEDFLTIMATLRSEFRYVWLYILGGQGVLVAANDAGAFPSEEKMNKLGSSPRLQTLLGLYGGSARSLTNSLLASPADVDRLLTEAHIPGRYLVSTDDNLKLEYETPKGNVLDYDTAERIVSVLRKVHAASVSPELPLSKEIGSDRGS
jgi:spermidine synthase